MGKRLYAQKWPKTLKNEAETTPKKEGHKSSLYSL
jgi:hypothetical protein